MISTEGLNKIIGIEEFEGEETVLVEPGASLKDLSEWLHLRDRALGYGFVGFKGISVGGSTATAAHGSSPRHSPILATEIQGVTIITADGRLKEFTEKNTDHITFKALRAHLGMLGVVVQLRIKIRPQFNLETFVSFESDKEILGEKNAVDLIRNCDFGQIHWFPHSGKVMRTCGHETQKPTDPGANNTILTPFTPSVFIVPYKLATHYGACNKRLNSFLEDFRLASFALMPPFKKDNFLGHSINSRHVIGPSHRMLSSEFALAENSLVFRDWEIAIPESQLSAALNEIHDYLKSNKIALPLSGIFLRFAPVEEQTLISPVTSGGHFNPGEIAVYVEIPSYHAIGFSPALREEHDHQYEEIAKLLISKYHGRAHWGKNQKSVFTFQSKLDPYKNGLDRFRKVVRRFDPRGVFQNEFGEAL